MNGVCKEAHWLKSFVGKMWLINGNTNSMKIICNSQSGIKPSRNEFINRRSKHIDISFHFVRNVVANEEEQLEYIHTKEVVDNIMNKSLGRI